MNEKAPYSPLMDFAEALPMLGLFSIAVCVANYVANDMKVPVHFWLYADCGLFFYIVNRLNSKLGGWCVTLLSLGIIAAVFNRDFDGVLMWTAFTCWAATAWTVIYLYPPSHKPKRVELDTVVRKWQYTAFGATMPELTKLTIG